MTQFLFLIIGLATGLLIGWLLGAARSRSTLDTILRGTESRLQATEGLQAELREQLQSKDLELKETRNRLNSAEVDRATTLARLESAQTNLEDQKGLLNDATEKLSDAFKALSSDALNQNNATFLQLAAERMRTVQQEAQNDLTQREQAIESLVNPLGEALRRYEEQIQRMEAERHRAFGNLEQAVKTLGETSQRLQSETTNLVSALTKPGVKGRWGEITLRRVVEAAGMSEHCDFVEQPSAETPEGRRRPDLIVKLPGGRSIVIDAKVSLRAYLDAVETSDEVRRRELMLEHTSAVRASMKELGSKNYWSQFDEAPNFVVLFLPWESSFSVAVDLDRELVVDGIANRVVLATPTTLIACLLIVAYGWQQQRMEENSRKIAEAGSDLYERILKFTDYLQNIRDGLERVCHSVNDAIGSFDSRLVPGARKLRDLGAGGEMEEVRSPEVIETPLRSPHSS